MSIATFKDLCQAFQALVSLCAVIVGGIWTYRIFVKKREEFPKADFKHEITHTAIDDDRKHLHVVVTVTNKGNVLLALVEGFVRIQRMVPWPNEVEIPDGEREVPWPLLCQRNCNWNSEAIEIEPGESEELHFDFVVEHTEKVVVYSYFKNLKKHRKREIGWNKTTTYDILEKRHDEGDRAMPEENPREYQSKPKPLPQPEPLEKSVPPQPLPQSQPPLPAPQSPKESPKVQP